MYFRLQVVTEPPCTNVADPENPRYVSCQMLYSLDYVLIDAIEHPREHGL